MTPSGLFWGLLFGCVGLGYFVYGRKERAAVPLVCGVALMVFPYLVDDTLLLVALGVVVAAVPWFVRT